MSLAPYAALLRRPGVLRLFLVALVARIPHAATGVVLTLNVVGALGRGYAAAGLVAASMTVGMAFGAPWRGRRVDTLGVRRALLPSVIVEAGVWVVAPFLGYGALVAAAFVAGVFLVPVFSVVRQSLGVLVPVGEQRTAYALDSVGTELTFMLAPALGVVIATQVSTTAALVTVGLATVGSGALLMWFDPPVRSHQLVAASEAGTTSTEPTEARTGAARARILTPALLAVLSTSVAASLVLNGTDVSIVASLTSWGRASSLGWMMALWSAGSVVGGLAYGAGRRTMHPLAFALTLAVLTAPAAFVRSPALLAVAVFVAGLPCAPALSSITATLARVVPEERRGEALGWQGTAMTVGGTLGAPLCGWMIDARGPGAGFLTAAVAGALLASTGLVALRRFRGGPVRAEGLAAAEVS